MSDPLALARIRAQRTIPAPARETDLAALRIAAHRAGRQLLDVPEHGRGRRFLLGWPDGIDVPAAASAREDGVRQVTPSVLLVLAACLGCCWPSGPKRRATTAPLSGTRCPRRAAEPTTVLSQPSRSRT